MPKFLFVVRPHSQNLDDLIIFKDLVDQLVLNVDASRISTCEIAQQLLVTRRCLVWIVSKNFKQPLSLRSKSRSCKFLCVPASLSGVYERVAHQPGSLEHFSTGVAIPFWILSRIPGTD